MLFYVNLCQLGWSVDCGQNVVKYTHTQTILIDVRSVGVPKYCIKVSRKCRKVLPLFFIHTLLLQNLAFHKPTIATSLCNTQISDPRCVHAANLASMLTLGTPGGVRMCPNTGYINTLLLKISFVKKWKVTHFSKVSSLARLYPTAWCIHMWRQGFLFLKLNVFVVGVNLSVTDAPVSPYIF